MSGQVTESGFLPTRWPSWVLIAAATWSLPTISTMSNLTPPPSTLVTVTLTPNGRFLTFISQVTCAPTVAGRSFGQFTDSGLLPAASVIFAEIWPATSLLLTACDEPIEQEQPATAAMRPAAAHETGSARMTVIVASRMA